jgi:hypothetical protein
VNLALALPNLNDNRDGAQNINHGKQRERDGEDFFETEHESQMMQMKPPMPQIRSDRAGVAAGGARVVLVGSGRVGLKAGSGVTVTTHSSGKRMPAQLPERICGIGGFIGPICD